jgi:flagellin-like protein
MLKRNDEAVSPVIGVILMVAIAVILSSVVLMFVFGMGKPDPKGPTAAITVTTITETIGIPDLKIQHKGGDRLVGGDWFLSIVPAGQPPAYVASSPGSDFVVGDQIITTNVTTNSSVIVVTNSSVYYTTAGSGSDMVIGQKYDVKMIIYPFKTMIVDTVVEVR